LLDRASGILKSVFGFDDFRPSQEKIIEQILQGNDALVLMPTGGGKSLCYQIPAMVREGTGIVVSPLIALMQDQVDTLKQLGVKAAFLNSTLEFNEARIIEQQLLDNQLDILYVAPERLLTDRMLQLLDQSTLALFAIEVGLLDVKQVLDLDEREYDEIVFAIESLEDEEQGCLKQVYEALEESYDYGILRCVQASI